MPYEAIVRATSGEPEAMDEVLRHYSRRIRIAAINTGRKFICFETAPAFYGSATERIAQARAALAAGGKGL